VPIDHPLALAFAVIVRAFAYVVAGFTIAWVYSTDYFHPQASWLPKQEVGYFSFGTCHLALGRLGPLTYRCYYCCCRLQLKRGIAIVPSKCSSTSAVKRG
jgi:hypothetical protein